MNPGAIVAIGVGVGVALVLALFAARRGGQCGSDLDYGNELDAPPGGWRGRRARPGGRQRAALVALAASLAALGAGLATGLGHGGH